MSIDKDNITIITAIIGAALGLLGAVLGIINLWRSFDRDRVNIKVIPKIYFTSYRTSGICIEIINLGFIPVTISQIGFTSRTSDKWIADADLIQNLPHRMEPRTAFTAYLAAGKEQESVFADVGKAFVQTQCGRKFTGNSAALRGIINSTHRAFKKPHE